MNTDKTAGKSGQRLIISAIALIFLLPVAVSWGIYYFTDIGRDEDAGSYGDLVDPPLPMADKGLIGVDTDGNARTLHGKWSLMYVTPGDCDPSCRIRLDQMAAIRLALGNDAARLQLLLGAADEGTIPVLKQFLRGYDGQRVWIMFFNDARHAVAEMTPKTANFEQGNLYLIDPLGNLMMKYSSASDPEGIIRDLKQLLRYSRIG